MSSQNELRGELLREVLLNAKLQTPDMSLHQALKNAVMTPATSSIMSRFKARRNDYGETSISTEHFDLFVTTLVNLVKNKKAANQLNDITIQQIKALSNQQVMDRIWGDVDVNSFFQITQNFDPIIGFVGAIQPLLDKSKELKARGYLPASDELSATHKYLRSLMHLLTDDSQLQLLEESCNNKFDSLLQNSSSVDSVSQYRGVGAFFHPIQNFFIVLYNFLTPHAINLETKKTDSVIKINEVKQALFTHKIITMANKAVNNVFNESKQSPIVFM